MTKNGFENNTESYQNNMIETINKVEKNKKMRKAVLSDFFTNDDKPINMKNNKHNNNDKLKRTRMQGDYGEKKFIKP